MLPYSCQKCGKPAGVVDGKVVRTCTCNAPVIAHMKAHATGKSKVANGGV